MAQSPSEELTIDKLARVTGTTVRTIRAYQSRGLLPPPQIRVRTGYYGPEHVTRLRVIRAMLAEGFRLEAIRRLIEHPGGAAEQIFKFGRVLLDSFGEPFPEFATTSELAERLGEPVDLELLLRAQQLGLIRPLGEDRWEIRNPTLVSAGEQLIAMGIPLSHALEVAEEIDRHTRAIAQTYVRLFIRDLMGGDRAASRPEGEWERLNDAFQRLRPLATDAIRASFEQVMGDLVEQELLNSCTNPERP